MDYSEMWLTVFCEGEVVSSDSGFGTEAGWSYKAAELSMDGQDWRAEKYITEARSVRDLYVYSTSAEEWVSVWYQDEDN